LVFLFGCLLNIFATNIQTLNHFFLISDFNSSAYQIGLLKQQIFNIDSNAYIIDFFHHIRLNNISEAAFMTKKIKKDEKNNQIIIVQVGNIQNWILYIDLNNYYLLPNNGLLSLIIENVIPSQVFSFNKNDFESTINKIISNQINQLNPTKDFIQLFQRRPFIEGNILTAEVIHIDFHGNCYFNIDKKTITDFIINSNYQIKVQHFQGVVSNRIFESIAEIQIGTPGFIFSKNGYLKLVFNMGNAMKLFRIKDNTKIIIEKAS
jgi:S-adenosyl-L-methionine hydrolase (adenosine-forming)